MFNSRRRASSTEAFLYMRAILHRNSVLDSRIPVLNYHCLRSSTSELRVDRKHSGLYP